MTVPLVPRALLSPPEAARKRVAVIVGAATAGCALAGLWLRFEDGFAMRTVMAVTSAVLGALAIDVALQAKSAGGAVGRALGLSTVFGIMSTLAPSVMMSVRGSEPMVPFVVCLIAGAFFGSFIGFLYGLALSIFAGFTWKHVASRTHDGADRAARIAGIWAIVPALLTSWVLFGYDFNRQLSEWASDRDREAHAVAVPLGIVGLGVIVIIAIASFFVAHRRLVQRRRWLREVEIGRDAKWSVREIGPHDDVERLPRLRDGFMILEHKNEVGAYRANATTEAIALV